jgi:pimeloyl-ACP methyl ester carboxylesterase
MPFVPPAATRSSGPTTTLTRVLRRVPTRTLDPHDADDVYAAWTTSEISITTVRPRPTTTIAATAQPIALGAGVTLEPHPSLRAEARLSTVAEASRSLGNLTLPAILRDDPAVSQPLQFTVSRGSEPGLSVLELSHVVDHTVVTPEQPLRLRGAAPLGADEHVLPLGYDGEFYLPLGTAQRVDDGIAIELQRLPAPVANGARDLKGSIRILFQKMIGQRLGMSYAYPLLAATYVARDGGLTMYADPDQVRKRVAAAQRIVVYIHGIIGDTHGMAASARGHTLQRSAPLPESVPPHLAEHYDLLLTFDYENIHTTIEETARGLKQRLEAVGLHAGHGKTLHIVAHSMGGLVARWFIEREGGADIVQHLVMLGTPNGGSPWPHVQAWATTALGIGLNSLSVIAWPAQVVSSLVSAVEMIDRSLDQMQPNSAFLNELNSSPDPQVPYTVLAGNTSLLPAMFTPEVERDSTRLERLLERLRPRDLALKAGALAFFGMPNDVAVSVASIKHVSPYRAPAPVVQEVACDHMSYFSTLVGLQALADALDVGAAANVVGGS